MSNRDTWVGDATARLIAAPSVRCGHVSKVWCTTTAPASNPQGRLLQPLSCCICPIDAPSLLETRCRAAMEVEGKGLCKRLSAATQRDTGTMPDRWLRTPSREASSRLQQASGSVLAMPTPSPRTAPNHVDKRRGTGADQVGKLSTRWDSSTGVGDAAAFARARGRRLYNKRRRIAQGLRCRRLLELMREHWRGFDADWGFWRYCARQLGVTEGTISKDLARLRAELSQRRCPCCLRPGDPYSVPVNVGTHVDKPDGDPDD